MNYLTLPNLARIAVLVAVVKFALEGVTVGELTIGHTDSGTYAMFLAPILAHHAYTNGDKSNDNKT